MRFVMTSHLQASAIALGMFSQRKRVDKQFLLESRVEMDSFIHSPVHAFSRYPSGRD